MATILFPEAWDARKKENSSTQTFGNNELEGGSVTTESIMQTMNMLFEDNDFKVFLHSLNDNITDESID